MKFPVAKVLVAKVLVVLAAGLFGWAASMRPAGAEDSATDHSPPPNVLMIAIDDLNDWVEPLGGHPDVQTPAMVRLAARGVTFTNAHCQAPLCNPSRTSLMTSRRPSTTGIYGLAPWIRDCPDLRSLVTLPQHFRAAGYRTLIGGKIYHGPYGRRRAPDLEADEWGPPSRVGARPAEKLIPPTPGGNHPLMDWGTFPHADRDKGDWAVASWASEKIASLPNDKPFFLSAGFFLPHVPCYATPKWFDLYPPESVSMPILDNSDRYDTPAASWYLHWELPEPRTSWLLRNNQLKPLVRAYLASVSFVDSQVGRILQALADSPHADNTVVILWSDHGYHLGEKSISGKNSLWGESTRVPLIIAGPGIDGGRVCAQPAELLDVFPTLADLAGLAPPEGAEGVSLAPQLDDVTAARQRPAICTHNAGNHSVCDTRYRYIRYADGSEELYDFVNDPAEITNLLFDNRRTERHEATARRLAEWLPQGNRPPAVGSRHRVLEKRGDAFFWEGKRVVDAERID